MISNEFEISCPPKEIFKNPEAASWSWDKRADAFWAKASVVLDKEKGLLYYPERNKPAFKGFRFPPITDALEIPKRFILMKLKELKNPLNLISYKRIIKEIDELFVVSIQRYYMLPEYYCRAVQEIYRVGKIISNSDWVDRVCMFFQWDSGYRARFQLVFMKLNKQELLKNPRKEISRILLFGERYEIDNPLVKSKWKLLRRLFNILWFISPKLRKAVKIFAQEVRIEKFIIDNEDAVYFFKGQYVF